MPPENIRKSVFSVFCFQWVQKEISGITWFDKKKPFKNENSNKYFEKYFGNKKP